ncbi:hypothetical protein QQ045_024856 [Rhodiola kirilowii]
MFGYKEQSTPIFNLHLIDLVNSIRFKFRFDYIASESDSRRNRPLKLLKKHSVSPMDKGVPGRQEYGVPKGEYRQFPNQVPQPQRPSMKDIMTVVSERDAAFLERNIVLSEKRAVLAERDMAVIQRDAAIAERDNAIQERDRVIAHLQLLESITSGGNA